MPFDIDRKVMDRGNGLEAELDGVDDDLEEGNGEAPAKEGVGAVLRDAERSRLAELPGLDDRPYLLKCLSGPNAGAEAALARGELAIGSSHECDIILWDASVSPLHISLRLDEDGITLIRVMAPILDGDGTSLEEGEQLPYLRPIRIGASILQIGPRDEIWPAAPLPISLRTPIEGRLPVAAFEAEPRPMGELSATSAPRPSLFRRTGLWLAGVGLGLAGVIAAASFVAREPLPTSDVKSDPAAASHPSPSNEERAREVAGELGLAARIVIREGSDGRVLIKGTVDRVSERRRLINGIEGKTIPAVFDVSVKDTILTAAKDTLAAFGVDATVVADDAGRLQLIGFVPNSLALQRAMDALRQDVPGVRSVESRVLTPATAVPAMKQILERHRLQGKVKLSLSGIEIAAIGALDATELAEWSAAAKEFEETYGEALKLSPSFLNRLPTGTVPVASAVIGPSSFVMLTDGNRYSVGASTPGGYRIDAIEADRLRLSRNGQTFVQMLSKQIGE